MTGLHNLDLVLASVAENWPRVNDSVETVPRRDETSVNEPSGPGRLNRSESVQSVVTSSRIKPINDAILVVEALVTKPAPIVEKNSLLVSAVGLIVTTVGRS